MVSLYSEFEGMSVGYGPSLLYIYDEAACVHASVGQWGLGLLTLDACRNEPRPLHEPAHYMPRQHVRCATFAIEKCGPGSGMKSIIY